MRSLAVLAPLAVALPLVGCGSSSSNSSGGSSSGSSASGAVTVNESEFKLDPQNATVKANGGSVTITVKNGGSIVHALSIEKAGPGGQDLKTASIQPGSSTTLKATLKPGTYEWYCPIDHHKQMGMDGKITIT
jgi:uncharacterized cupredoxin-like copper-binding protein